MRRIQSWEVWRDKNSRQRKVYTKASRAVNSVSRTEKTMEGSEWAGERHKGRWRDRQRPFMQGSLRIMIQSLESVYTHYIFVRWMKVFYFSWKKNIFVVKNAPFQFFFEHEEMLHVSYDRKLVPDVAIKAETHHCSCFFYLQKQRGSLMFWELDPDMKKKHESMKETGLSFNLSKKKQCQKNCEQLWNG